MSIVTTYTNARASLAALCDEVASTREPVIIRRRNAEEHALSQLVADMSVEEGDVTRQVDRVEAVRSELSKTRLLMVFRMYRVLEPDQRDALDQWRNRGSSSQHSDGRRSRQR